MTVRKDNTKERQKLDIINSEEKQMERISELDTKKKRAKMKIEEMVNC